mgnify:FL=1
MTQCVEIKVFGLSREASARLGGATEAVLDLSADFSLRLSKDVERLSSANKISTEGALGFDAEFTKTNNAIFSEFSSPLTLDSTTVFYRVGVTANGHGLQFDRLVVTGKTDKWELELRRSPDHWVELASQYTTNDVDFGVYPVNKSYIETHWADAKYEGLFPFDPLGQSPTYWPLIDYGGWCDQTLPPDGAQNVKVKVVGLEDLRPLISFVYLLKQGFCLFGWTIESVIFETDWFKAAWLYALRPDYYIASTIGGRITGRALDRYEVLPFTGIDDHLYFDEDIQTVSGYQVFDSGAGAAHLLCGVTNVPEIALQYTFSIKGTFTNDRPLFFNAIFVVYEAEQQPSGHWQKTGEIISTESFDVHFDPNETKYVDFEQTVILKPGQTGIAGCFTYPSSGFWVEKGMYFKCVPANNSLMTSDIINVSDCISDDNTILDWTKAFCQLIDGRAETLIDEKRLIIHPNKRADIYGTVAPQFLKVEESAIDISALIIQGSIKDKPTRKDLKRYTRVEFADAGDAYIDFLNLSEPAHSRTITNGVDLPDAVDSIQNPVIEPTLEGQPTLLASPSNGIAPSPYLPRLWDNTDGARSFDIGPRILFAHGLVSQKNPSPKSSLDTYAAFFFNESVFGTPTVEFGYATQLRTWELDPAPVIDGSIVFSAAPYDLFVTFWLGLTLEQRSGTVIDLLMRMQMKDYVGYDFRNLYLVNYNGIPLRVPMTGIRDFQTCGDIPTPVTFFVDPVSSSCCDLPCGCQFTTCDYYQDMGVFMQQATLNSMYIDSFVVDGIELLSAPVAMGAIEIVDVGGYPFVKNLIDTLNGIGAPYFSFGISTRIHPERGARFFTLKRLACVPFRILITLSGNECYLYTQDEQQTKYFTGGTWEDFGYGSAFYGEPIDCVTTTEY